MKVFELAYYVVSCYPNLAEQYELYLALKDPVEQTLELLLEIASGQYGDISVERVARHDYPEELCLTLSPASRDSIPARFVATTHPGAKLFLARILLASGNPEYLITLAQDEAGRSVIRRFGWGTGSSVMYACRPIGATTTSYELIPRDLAVLRKGLFALTASEDQEITDFATEYLEHIDQERGKAGSFDIGPRHPDITTGRPWPAIEVGV